MRSAGVAKPYAPRSPCACVEPAREGRARDQRSLVARRLERERGEGRTSSDADDAAGLALDDGPAAAPLGRAAVEPHGGELVVRADLGRPAHPVLVLGDPARRPRALGLARELALQARERVDVGVEGDLGRGRGRVGVDGEGAQPRGGRRRRGVDWRGGEAQEEDVGRGRGRGERRAGVDVARRGEDERRRGNRGVRAVQSLLQLRADVQRERVSGGSSWTLVRRRSEGRTDSSVCAAVRMSCPSPPADLPSAKPEQTLTFGSLPPSTCATTTVPSCSSTPPVSPLADPARPSSRTRLAGPGVGS